MVTIPYIDTWCCFLISNYNITNEVFILFYPFSNFKKKVTCHVVIEEQYQRYHGYNI